MPNPAEIDRRFQYQPPDDETKLKHEIVNADFLELAHALDDLLPDGREKALAITELESARMRAHQAIATAPRVKLYDASGSYDRKVVVSVDDARRGEITVEGKRYKLRAGSTDLFDEVVAG